MTTVKSQKLMSQEEQIELFEKTRAMVGAADCTAAITFDTANIAYATSMVFPYNEQYAEPRLGLVLFANSDKKPILFLPAVWSQLADQQGWKGDQIIYSVEDGLYPDGLVKRLAQALVNAGLSNAVIGYDRETISQTVFGLLTTTLPDAKFVPLDDGWHDLRMIKTAAEVRMLEEAARQGDRALVSALNHSEGCAQDQLSYSLWEFAERIRVHVGEFGGSGTGQVAVMQGQDMRVYSKPPQGLMKPGCPLRAEFTSHHLGFWSSGARTLHVGAPAQIFSAAYQQNIDLKRKVLGYLRPGAICSQIYQTIADEAKSAGIDLWNAPGLGHGVGRSEREAPFLCPEDDTTLQPGMVIVVAIYTRGPSGELICSKDTVLINDSGFRLLSWYRDWDSKMYALVGITARHG